LICFGRGPYREQNSRYGPDHDVGPPRVGSERKPRILLFAELFEIHVDIILGNLQAGRLTCRIHRAEYEPRMAPLRQDSSRLQDRPALSSARKPEREGRRMRPRRTIFRCACTASGRCPHDGPRRRMRGSPHGAVSPLDARASDAPKPKGRKIGPFRVIQGGKS
jgi:hypothetical protein